MGRGFGVVALELLAVPEAVGHSVNAKAVRTPLRLLPHVLDERIGLYSLGGTRGTRSDKSSGNSDRNSSRYPCDMGISLDAGPILVWSPILEAKRYIWLRPAQEADSVMAKCPRHCINDALYQNFLNSIAIQISAQELLQARSEIATDHA
jgi:hypothetical protein